MAPNEAVSGVSCLALQLEILHDIVYVESRIRRLRQLAKRRRQLLATPSTPRLSRDAANHIKNRLQLIDDRIDDYQQLLIALRQVGDGIAFQVLDKWDIKLLSQKQHAGFISEKDGLAAEIDCLKYLFSTKHIAVLNDLTTCLRHGDITYVVDSLPIIIEVTVGRAKSSRKHRQLENAEKVVKLIHDDISNEYYNSKHITTRIALHSPEQHHRQLLNQLAEQARRDGGAWLAPEPGLRYLVQYSEPILRDAESLEKNDAWRCCFLSEYKQACIANLPFPLLWTNPETMCDWYEHRFFVVIFFSLRFFRESLSPHGLDLEYRENPEYPYWVVDKRLPNGGIQVGVGWKLFSRIFTECWSLEWFAKELVSRYSVAQSNAVLVDGKSLKSQVLECGGIALIN